MAWMIYEGAWEAHGEGATPLREADVNRFGRRAARALITPALFSQSPPHPPGEEGEVSL